MSESHFDAVVGKYAVNPHRPLDKADGAAVVEKFIDAEGEGGLNSADTVEVEVVKSAAAGNIVLLNDGVGRT